MRRIVVLGVLLAMMLAITALQTSQSAAHDPMTLAAIGFVILAAYTVSEVGSLLQLPQVTGYIVAGLALGPAAANILSSEVVVEMKMFNTLALGLIATGAGLELDVSRLRRVWKTLIATVGVKVILSGSFVIATLLAVQTALGSLELGSKAELISLSLVLGVLSLTTSPAIVMAVLNETKSKGRMTDLALGAAVLKDLVVVTLLALVVAVSRTLLAPDAEVDARVIINVGKEIASSIAAGGVLGVLLILYIRYVRAEMLLFVAAMILVVSELGRALHLEILLVFITAGFVVRNFSHHEEELASPLSLVSLPVFVLFFTNAGASVDLRTTLTILPLALAICAARAIAFYLSARAGGAVGQEDFQVRRFAWLGYLPQAGVTLGLVGLAAQQLPDLAGPISTTGMAMVAINLLIGPISLRHALRATGDIEGVPASRRSSAPSSKHPSVIPEEPLEKAEADAAASIERATAAIDEEKNEKLRSMAQQTHTHLRQSVDGFYRDLLEPWAATFRSELRDSLTMIAKDRGSPQVWLESITLPDVSAQGETCKKLFESLRSPISSLPDHVTADLDASQLAVSSDDSIALFIRKRFRSLWILAFRQPAVRTIPVRLVARSSLEPSLSAISAAVLESWYAMQAGMLHQLSAFASDSESLAHVLQRTDEQMETWLGRVRASLDMAVSTAMTTMTRTLSEVGSPTMPTTTLRYSTVEPQVREAIRKLHEEPSAWLSKMEAARAAPYLTACLARLDRTTRDAVDRHISQRSESAAQTMVPIILAVRERIATIRNNIENPDLVLDVKAIQQACREAYPEREELQIDRVGDLRPTASIHNVSLDLRAVVRELPEELTVLPPSVNLQDVQRARDVVTRTIHFRALAAHHTLWSFLPPLDDCVQRASLSLSRSNGRVREAIDWALDSVDGIGDGPDDEMPHVEEFLSALEEVEQRLRELEADVHGTTEGLQREVMDCVTSVSRAMLADATGQKAEGPELPGASTWSAQLRQRLSILVAPAKMRMLRYRARAMEIAKRFGGSALSKDLRLRLEKPVLDAVSIHKYVSRWRAPLAIPDTYARLFEDQPVRDYRRFTANEASYEALLEAERAWEQGSPGSVLLVGPHGSGRTSLLNLCEIEMSAPRFARPNRSMTLRSHGIIGALAVELECPPRARHVAHALRQVRTLVFIDDLEQWLTPSAAGMRDLERFLSLIAQTHEEVFWLISIQSEALRLIEEALPIRASFGQVITLRPLKLDDLIRAVEGRHLLSGMQVRYPQTVATRLLGRLRASSDRTLFFRGLLSHSEGNLERAIALWRRSVHFENDDLVTLEMPQGMNVGLPFLDQMNVREIAMLVHLARFGAMTTHEIALGIGTTTEVAERHIEFLRMAGLLDLAEGSENEFIIPKAVRPPILMALRNRGAWS